MSGELAMLKRARDAAWNAYCNSNQDAGLWDAYARCRDAVGDAIERLLPPHQAGCLSFAPNFDRNDCNCSTSTVRLALISELAREEGKQ